MVIKGECYGKDKKQRYYQNYSFHISPISVLATVNIFSSRGTDKMKINTIVIDCGDSILLYLGTDADSKKLPGIKGQLEDSFSSRMDAIYKWFLTQF